MSNTSDGYTVKEMLALMEETFNRRFDKLEQKMDQSVTRAEWVDISSRVTKLEVEGLRREGPVADTIKRVEQDIDKLKDDALSPLAVKEMIGLALQDSSARGWTNRERYLGIVVVSVSLLTFAINVISTIRA